MTFQTTSFFILFCGLILLLGITKKERIRQFEILIASIIFYASWDLRFLLLIFLCILIAHISVWRIHKNIEIGGGAK